MPLSMLMQHFLLMEHKMMVPKIIGNTYQKRRGMEWHRINGIDEENWRLCNFIQKYGKKSLSWGDISRLYTFFRLRQAIKLICIGWWYHLFQRYCNKWDKKSRDKHGQQEMENFHMGRDWRRQVQLFKSSKNVLKWIQ